MTSTKGRLLLGFTIMLFLTSCFKKPELKEIKSINFVELQDSILHSEVVVVVQNSNALGASIKNQKASIYIEGVNVGTANNGRGYKLKKNDTTSIALDSRINLNAISKIFKQVLDQDKTTVIVDGEYVVNSKISSVKLKAKTKSEINIKGELTKMLESTLNEQGIRVTKIRPKSTSFSTTTVGIDVSLNNGFPFEYQVGKVRIDLYPSSSLKSPLGSWESAQPIRLKPNSKQEISGTIEFDNKTMLSSFGSLFGKKTVKAKGKANIIIGSNTFEIPIDQDFDWSSALMGN
jgi:LEA14-like dessication related protein